MKEKFEVTILTSGFSYSPRSYDRAVETVTKYIRRKYGYIPEIEYHHWSKDYIEVFCDYGVVTGNIKVASITKI